MANYNWYRTSHRRTLVDMHIEDWNDEFLSKFDAGAYFECLKRGHVQSPMIYLQSHVGLCNWPTKTGRTHRAFASGNKIKELVDLCHAGGKDAVGYYSLIYNNWAYENHPNWRMKDKNGKASREKGAECRSPNRYGILCPNNAEYRTFVTAQLEELLDIYDIDGMFVDMAFWPMVCYCDACRDRYRTETGREIPNNVDWHNPDWVRFQRKREDWMSEFARFSANEVRRLRPGLPVEHNYAPACFNWLHGVNEGPSEASDYTGGDLYGGHHEESFICKLYYELSRNQPFEYMTSRCDPDLAAHTTTKSLEDLKLHNYLTLAHHGAMLFIDAIDPRGTMNTRFYDVLGVVYQESIPYEKHLKGSMVSDVAIYFDMESKMRYLPEEGSDQNSMSSVSLFESPVYPTNEGYDLLSYPQLNSTIGSAIALTNGNFLYTVIPNCRKERILDKKVVIVSEAPFLSDEEIEHFAAYVQNGGSLYMSGSVNPKLPKKLLGLEHLGYTDESITYIAPTADGQPYFGEMYDKDYPISYSDKQMRMSNPLGNKVLATITLPYTNPKDTTMFASIHSNPPGVRTDLPSIVYGQYGKGKAIWSAASFESNQQQAHKNVFLRLIQLVYGGNSMLSSTAPRFVEFTLFNDQERSRFLLHAVNVQEHMPYIKVGDFSVSLKTDKPVRSVRLLPDSTEVKFDNKDGLLTFEVNDIELFKMYEFLY